MYSHSMRPLYEQLEVEKHDVQWTDELTEIGPSDTQIVVSTPDLEIKTAWERCIFVPHSVSEYFPYGWLKPERWGGHTFKGILSVGLETDLKTRDHPLCLPQNVKRIGWPRGDILFGSEREAVERRLRESLTLPHEKTVLIMCAEPGHLDWELRILNEVIPLSKGKFNVLLKGRDEFYPDLFSDRENIRYIAHPKDATPYYLITDLLLSVHPASSALIEIGQVNKPSIAVNFGGENFIERWRYFALGEADVLCRIEDLKSNILTLLKTGEEYSPQIRAKLERFIYKPDGHATERGVKALKELIKW